MKATGINEQLNKIDEASMQLFADGDNSFHMNDWIAWEMACLYEERMIPPKEFKRLPALKKTLYLKNSLIVGCA